MWCPLPWIHQFITTSSIKTCCIGKVTGPASPCEFIKSPILKDIKQSILDNKIHPNCTDCALLESQGYTSVRQEALRDYPFFTKSNVPDQIEYLDLRYSNLCNFKCRTCEPAFSSSIVKEIELHPKLSKYYRSAEHKNSFEFLAEDIFQFLPSIKKINFTGGEPLLIKDNIKILEKLVELEKFDCEILITTNCSVDNPKWHSLLSKFNHVHWTLSVDGVDRCAEYLRYGTNWGDVDKNIKNIVQSTHSVAFNTTISAYSILNVNKLVKYYLEVEKISNGPIELWFHLCSIPAYLHPGVLKDHALFKAKDSISEAIELLSDSKYRTNVDFLINVYDNLESKTELTTKFLEFTRDLDTARNQSFETLL